MRIESSRERFGILSLYMCAFGTYSVRDAFAHDSPRQGGKIANPIVRTIRPESPSANGANAALTAALTDPPVGNYKREREIESLVVVVVVVLALLAPVLGTHARTRTRIRTRTYARARTRVRVRTHAHVSTSTRKGANSANRELKSFAGLILCVSAPALTGANTFRNSLVRNNPCVSAAPVCPF